MLSQAGDRIAENLNYQKVSKVALAHTGEIGAAVVDQQLASGAARKRVGLVGSERMPVREGAKIVDEAGTEIGVVTSGSFCPTISAAVGFAYVQPPFTALGTTFSIDNGRTLLPATVVEAPFYRKK